MPQFRFDIVQGTDPWYWERMGRATASNYDRIVTEVKGEYSETGAKKYAREVAIQRLLDEETEGRISHLPQIQRGKVFEPDAVEAYEKRTKTQTTKIGLVISDDGTRSCSPDLIFGDPDLHKEENPLIGAEVKCPGGPNHLLYIEHNGPGRKYIWQVVGSMLIAGFDAWDFFSYHPGLDPVMVRYQRKNYAKELDILEKSLVRFEAEVKSYIQLMRDNGYEEPIGKASPHRIVLNQKKLTDADANLWAIG